LSISSQRSRGLLSSRPSASLAAFACGLLGLLALPGSVFAQSVPGYQVSTYATVTDPVLLSFGADGTLFTGRDPTASGSTTAVNVHKVGVGGMPVTALGNAPIQDPDTILLDAAGTISGVPGTLLVTGLLGNTGVGRISGIHPDGTVVTLFDTGNWANIVEMKFDLTGRLLFTALESRSIWTSTGGTPTILATLPGSAYPTYFTIGADNRITVGSSDNKILIYNADGSLANAMLATFNGLAGLEQGQGGAFGSDLYAIDSTLGTLVRVSPSGVKTTVGTGFATGFATKDIAFGPSGDLFVSVNTADKVLRISSPWTGLGCALAGVTGVPILSGSGSLAAASSNVIDLVNARPSAIAGLFVALSVSAIPFKGGTLKPFPFFSPVIIPTNASGAISIPFTMPAGVPSGTNLVLQWAIQDAAAVQGIALSNAVKGVTP